MKTLCSHNFVICLVFLCFLPLFSGYDSIKTEPETGHKFPEKCSDFSTVDLNSRCKHTKCVPKSSKGVDCFMCKEKCDNTCGPQNKLLNKLGIERLSGIFDFGPFCCIHDHCYYSSYSKKTCDEKFYDQMWAHCQEKKWWKASRLVCMTWAKTYDHLVRKFGNDSYNSAQSLQKKYEGSNACKRKLKTSYRSHSEVENGNYPYVFSHNMGQTSGSFIIQYNVNEKTPIKITTIYHGNSKPVTASTGLLYGKGYKRLLFNGKSQIGHFKITSPHQDPVWSVSIKTARQ